VAAPPELVKRVPLFGDLNDKEVQSLAASFKERTFGAGDIVASEGKGGVGFFIIGEGDAAVTVGGEVRRTLGPGDYFGEVALIDEGARSASIMAKTELKCYGLTAWEFRPLVESNGRIAWKLLQTMARRMRDAEQHD
jgi:CRP-like cAMP-binding protein